MEVSLYNNDKVKVNDHVYCASNWAVRDGTPYSIARIMEFLPSEGTSANTRLKSKGKDTFTRVRIAWYYRPGDITDRQVSDSRLLLAAIYTEVIPITHLRGKCWVRHKEKIPDLMTWRKKPDRFYYQRMFDPFIKKEFEVLPTMDIQNLPRHIRSLLSTRYEFVIAEKEVVSDLLDTLRLCHSCGEWCPTPESVQCASCRNHFHMACVQPPLLAKPARGYGWTCAPCSKQREDKLGAPREITPPKTRNGNGAASKKRMKRKERQLNIVNPEDDNDHYYKMWPFRYFGAHVNIEDAMDADDFIYVRAPPRVGQRYQVTLGVENIQAPRGSSDAQLPERGGDDTIEILSSVNDHPEEWFEPVEKQISQEARPKELMHCVDWLTEYFARVTHFDGKLPQSHGMSNPTRIVRKWKRGVHNGRYMDKEWTDNELAAFEDALSLHGPELRAVRDEVHTRSLPEVVRQFGVFKNKCLESENKVIRQREAAGAVSRKPSPSRQPLVTNDEESSVAKTDTSKRLVACAACGVASSGTWWKAPKGLTTPFLCNFCGVAWRKYGDLTLRGGREEPAANAKTRSVAEKRDGSPLPAPSSKKAKTMGVAVGSLQERLPIRQLVCQWCKKTGAIGKILKCSNCPLTVHSALCGVPSMEPAAAEGWLCELCSNEKNMEAALDGRCVVCPPPKADGAKDPTFLRCCKPTWSQKWVHVLCSLFFPEMQFSDVESMKSVEGVQTIPASKWKGTCSLCGQQKGAVIRCADCPQEFHVSCAYNAGYKCGFEITPVRNIRKEVLPVAVFKRETGIMNIYFWCNLHVLSFRRIYDLCEISSETNETALQVFTRTYKHVVPDNGHALLRKAEYLEVILNAARRESAGFAAAVDSKPSPKCKTCGSEHSPYFHFKDGGPECHRCRYKALKLFDWEDSETGAQRIKAIKEADKVVAS